MGAKQATTPRPCRVFAFPRGRRTCVRWSLTPVSLLASLLVVYLYSCLSYLLGVQGFSSPLVTHWFNVSVATSLFSCLEAKLPSLSHAFKASMLAIAQMVPVGLLIAVSASSAFIVSPALISCLCWLSAYSISDTSTSFSALPTMLISIPWPNYLGHMPGRLRGCPSFTHS